MAKCHHLPLPHTGHHPASPRRAKGEVRNRCAKNKGSAGGTSDTEQDRQTKLTYMGKGMPDTDEVGLAQDQSEPVSAGTEDRTVAIHYSSRVLCEPHTDTGREDQTGAPGVTTPCMARRSIGRPGPNGVPSFLEMLTTISPGLCQNLGPCGVQ